MKKIMSLMLLVVFSLMLAGCSNNEDLEKQIKDLEAKITALESSNTEQTTDITALETEIATIKQTLTELSTNQTANQTTITDLQTRLANLEAIYFDGIITVVLENEYGITQYKTIAYKEADELSLLELLDSHIQMDYSTSSYGTMLNSVGYLTPKTGAYIAILVNDEYSMVGIDGIEYENSDVITFRVEWWDETEQAVDDAILNFLINYADQYVNSTSIDHGVASALAHLGVLDAYISASDVTTMYEGLSQGEMTNDAYVNVLVKAIVTVSAIGLDPTDVNGNDLIAQLIALEAVGTYITPNAAIGLHAYSHTQDTSSYDALILNSLITNYDPSTVGIDMTGAALIGLSYYQDQTGVQTAVDAYINELSTNQLASGGLEDQDTVGWPVDENSSSIAQVILGLVANDIDPTGTEFTKDENNLVARLLDFENEGAFKYLLADENVDTMFSTPQAFMALVAYQQYKNSTGNFNLYDFN